MGDVLYINKAAEQGSDCLLFGPEVNGFTVRFYYRQFTLPLSNKNTSFEPCKDSPCSYHVKLKVERRYAVHLLLDCTTKFIQDSWFIVDFVVVIRSDF